MKIAALCNTDTLAIPSLYQLKEQGLLAGVWIPAQNAGALTGPLLGAGISQDMIYLMEKASWKESLAAQLSTIKPDMAWVFGMPWRIPQALLGIPAKGFFNFHFGSLPAYAGADPVFWQLRNNDASAALCVHRMTAAVDKGPVVVSKPIPVVAGDTYGTYSRKAGFEALDACRQLLELYNSDKLEGTPQHEGASGFFAKPGAAALSIDWQQQSATDIIQLVNATNPKYGGASTYTRGIEMRVLEVMPAEMNGAAEITPGTVVHADEVYGVIVACKDKQFLRIMTVHMMEGYFSGSRLFGMGIRAGEQFTGIQQTMTA